LWPGSPPLEELGEAANAGGYPYQFFYYSAFSRGDHEGKLAGRNVKLAPPSPASGVMRDGESLVQQHANTGHFATPYKFNAKELDMETGNYYYGARYYNPQVSVWLSVDPLVGNNPSLSSYNFVSNNPIMFIDPDGMDHWKIDSKGNVQFIDDNCPDVIVNGIRITDYEFITKEEVQALAKIMNYYANRAGDMSKYPNESVSIISYSYRGALKYQSSYNFDLDYKPYENRNDSGVLFVVQKGKIEGQKKPRLVVPLKNGKIHWLLSTRYNIINAMVHEDTHGGQKIDMSSDEKESEAYYNMVSHSTWNNTTRSFRERMYYNWLDYHVTKTEHIELIKQIESEGSYRNPRHL
jgi:RHS repeat-associated protein